MTDYDSEHELPPLTDIETEEKILQWILWGEQISQTEIVEHLNPDDFYSPITRSNAELIIDMHARGEKLWIDDFVDLEAFRGNPIVWKKKARDVYLGGTAWRRRLEHLSDLANRRYGLTLATEFQKGMNDTDTDIADVASDISERMIRFGELGNWQTPTGLTSSDAILEMETPADEWLIGGLLRVLDRMLLVGGEGSGKSTLLKQVAMLAASGHNPLNTGHVLKRPVRSLIVDVENRPATVRNQLSMIRRGMERAGIADHPDVPVWSKPEGLNLRNPIDRHQFEGVLQASRPDLIVMGPAYKLYEMTPADKNSHEQPVREVQRAIEKLQARYKFAIAIEHHAPLGDRKNREMRPADTAVWMRWPEFGLGLYQPEPGEWELKPFRQPRDPVWWPKNLTRSTHGNLPPWIGRFDFDPSINDGQPPGAF